MTKPELELEIQELYATIAELDQKIADRDQIIADQAEQLSQVVDLRESNTALTQQVDQLRGELALLKSPEVFTELAIGWMASAIGRRANDNPKVDLTGFNLGVQRASFPLIQQAYKNICATLKADGQAATTAEQQEIGLLLKRLGFA